MRQLDYDRATNGPSVRELESIYALDSIKQFGPQKFKLLHEAGLNPAQVLDDHTLLPISGKRGDQFRSEIAAITDGPTCRACARATAVGTGQGVASKHFDVSASLLPCQRVPQQQSRTGTLCPGKLRGLAVGIRRCLRWVARDSGSVLPNA